MCDLALQVTLRYRQAIVLQNKLHFEVLILTLKYNSICKTETSELQMGGTTGSPELGFKSVSSFKGLVSCYF